MRTHGVDNTLLEMGIFSPTFGPSPPASARRQVFDVEYIQILGAERPNGNPASIPIRYMDNEKDEKALATPLGQQRTSLLMKCNVNKKENSQ